MSFVNIENASDARCLSFQIHFIRKLTLVYHVTLVLTFSVTSVLTLVCEFQLWEEYFSLLTKMSAATILPVLLHPKSFGEVELNPEDPTGPPLINPRYLSHQKDVKTLIRGIRLVQKLVNTKVMKEFGARFNNMTLPGCEAHDFDSDDYWACYVRHLTLTSYHPVGTCRMGIDESDAVVDHRLR